MASETTHEFKISTSKIRGYSEGAIDLHINAPEQLADRGDFRGSGTVLVAFNSTGRVLGMIYVDELRTQDEGAVVELSNLNRLNGIPGYAFTEKMFATLGGKLKFQRLIRLTELAEGSRSNVGLTGIVTNADGKTVYVVDGKVVDGALFTVHLYRVMRLRYDFVAAGSHEQAADVARTQALSGISPVEIDDCDGQIISALVDQGGGENFDDTRLVKFVDSADVAAVAGELLKALKTVRVWSTPTDPDQVNWIDNLVSHAEAMLAE